MLWSALPGPDELLIEHVNPPEHATLSGRRASGGYHAFVYLFDGRLVHEGLGALLAHRLTRRRPITVTATATDQGLSLASPDPLDLTEQVWRELLSPDQLLEDLMACLNSSVLARRQFRDIARVAGLVVNGYPRRSGGGEKGGGRGGRPMRHLQASSEMFFDVLEQFDRGNLLLDQARREVLGSQLEVERVRSALERASRSSLRIITLDRLTPLAFPIWAETLRSTQTSSEKWSDLVQKMVARLESISTQHDARSGYASTRAVPQPS
jgi:ATP-dependent Lhr-like helicase